MNKVIHADCKDVLKKLIEDGVQVDSIVTDPPYELGFMGKSWDKTGIAYDVELWKLALQVLKPGGHLVSFSSSRTYHRMACAIEDAGFEIRDQIMWIYGQGFPKSLDISKAIDKKAGVEREVIGMRLSEGGCTGSVTFKGGSLVSAGKEIPITAPATELAKQWEGWGTALKPAHEPIVMARKPLSEKTVAENVIKWEVGGINIDGCRMGNQETLGRFPANLIHDGSDEVEKEFGQCSGLGSKESASRFFYCAKASNKDRQGSKHPTVKPIALMRYLCRLVTPPNGIVLDMFAGTGTTGQAAVEEGFNYILIEKEYGYILDIHKRLYNN